MFKSSSSSNTPSTNGVKHARNICKIYFHHRKITCDIIIEVEVLGRQQNNWIRVHYCGSNVNQKKVQKMDAKFQTMLIMGFLAPICHVF